MCRRLRNPHARTPPHGLGRANLALAKAKSLLIKSRPHAKRIEQQRTERRLTNLEIYDRTFKVVANLTRWQPSITHPAYKHLKPLNWDYVDKHAALSPEKPTGVVVLELFAGIMATTEGLLRNGIKIRKVYACEVDPKAREVAEFRLKALEPHLSGAARTGRMGRMLYGPPTRHQAHREKAPGRHWHQWT